MSKRHLFVILSGIITAAAIGGWYHGNTVTADSENAGVDANHVDESSDSAETQVIAADQHQNRAADLVDFSLKTSIRQVNDLAEQEQVRAMLGSSEQTAVIQLVDPEHAPDITGKPAKTAASDNLPSAYNALKQLSTDTGSVIICDLANRRILQSDDDETAELMMDRIGEITDGNGFIMHDADDNVGLTVFKCLDESREHCIASEAPLPILPDESIRCDLAAQSLVRCGDYVADSGVLFHAENCSNAKISGLQNLLDADANEGVLESDGEKYNYQRTILESGCIVVDVNSDNAAKAVAAPQNSPKPEPSAPSVSASLTSTPTWQFRHVAAAGGGGLLMILLGLWCTRGQKQNAPEKSQESLQVAANREAEERKALASDRKDDEIISLKAKIAELESAVDTANTQNHTLQQELEDSKRAQKQEELRNLSLEQEKRTLEDALAAAEAQNTEIANLRDLNNESINQSLLKDDFETVPEAPKAKSGTLDVKTNALFDTLSDDDWDDIADSFDMIMAPNQAPDVSEVPPLQEKVPTDILNGESSFGMTGFLSGIGTSDQRTKLNETPEKQHHTETRLKPIGDTPKLNDLPPILSNQPSKTGNTLPPLKPVPSLSEPPKPEIPNDIISMRTVEKPVIDSAADLAMPQEPKESPNSSFKPAPSWTGKKVIETGMDTNSLAEALKRRARDVSEVALPAISANPNEASHNLSKSGIFSVTGSRVDINPLSDNEYFKSLYDKFIQSQKECGEPTKFTLEQFVSRLAREKSHLMQTYKCKNVRFQVYIKDGKTSLKALPQK